MFSPSYELIESPGGVPVKAWVRGVAFDEKSREQVFNMASLPFIYKWIAVMPDVHCGIGATIGSVVPTQGAIIPAAVGVDLGCGMMAVQTSLKASDLPDHLYGLRSAIEKAVPHGRTPGRRDKGAWHQPPPEVLKAWQVLAPGFQKITVKHPRLEKVNHVIHLGTLGTGNHFVEICLDEAQFVWCMLHSGSRGVGNQIGNYFIEKAREEMRIHQINLPDRDLAYLEEGTRYFSDYVEAVDWAQRFAMINRQIMMGHILQVLRQAPGLPPFTAELQAVNCHHNYVQKEEHFGRQVWLTRKGAVSARRGELGIIPGSMGARSFIVRGKGNPESFQSCSHGAGRMMSRTEAKRRFSLEDHIAATQSVECRKDVEVIDETPAAYKAIEAVMKAQSDLVEIVHTLQQVICVKG